MEQVDLMARIQQAFPDVFSTPPNGTTALSAFHEGKIISPLGIEDYIQSGTRCLIFVSFITWGSPMQL